MTLYIDDGDFQLHVGDALEVLRAMPDESVHCCVTSPPYHRLRDYGTTGQLGLEATLAEYVVKMVEVFREVRRALRHDATLFLNLGDSHLNKQLQGVPWRVAFALQADGWYLRSDIIWSKPNPMPESVTDRPTKAHEYLFLLTRSPRYFFDQEAVREPAEWARWGDQTNRKHEGSGSAAGWIGDKPKGDLTQRRTAHYNTAERYGAGNGGNSGFDGLAKKMRDGEHAGRNVRSVWEIATQPYPDAHFATFPEALPDRCIRAGTSERGCCPVCGAPWERETEKGYVDTWQRNKRPGVATDAALAAGDQHARRARDGHVRGLTRSNTTTGWRLVCGCDDGSGIDDDPCFNPVPCTVLDPFMGSGTTALVARRLGRRSIGIELNPEYAELAARRLQQLSLLAEVPT